MDYNIRNRFFFIELVRTEMKALKFVLQNACNLNSSILLIGWIRKAL